MFCPNNECPDFVNSGLRSEYRQDISVCPFCGAHLVEYRPNEPDTDGDGSAATSRIGDDEELEPVIESTDLTEIAVIKTVLDAAGIPFIAQGEDHFGAFRGAFIGGSLFNPRARGVIFTVPIRMAEEARNVLEEFDGGMEEALDTE